MLFADLLSLHLVTFIMFFYSCNAFVVKSRVTTVTVPVHSLPDHHVLRAHRSFDISDANLYISAPFLY